MAKKHEEYRSRVCFDVDSEIRDELREFLSHGEIKALFTAFTEQLLELLKKYDPHVVKAGILSKQVTLSQLLDHKPNAPKSD